ncbi:MAG: DUF559 domain-containing protein [Aeromicrobium erythreum]
MLDVPDELVGVAFTVAQAEAAGVTRKMLQSRRFVGYGGGLYRAATTPHSLPLVVRGRLQQLGPAAAASHLTAVALAGLQVGPPRILHFATNRPHQRRRRNVVVHRHRGLLRPLLRDGIAVLDPYRTFVDCGAVVNDRNLLRIGDFLVAQGLVDREELRVYVQQSHLDGVRRARRVAEMVAAGVASVRESDVRWWLLTAGLPVPEVNADILDDHGRWLARGDLVYRRWKVLVEYDGWQHERDARQRQWDHLRREQLEAAGWRVVVVTSADTAQPSRIVQRVRQALRSRGCPC